MFFSILKFLWNKLLFIALGYFTVGFYLQSLLAEIRGCESKLEPSFLCLKRLAGTDPYLNYIYEDKGPILCNNPELLLRDQTTKASHFTRAHARRRARTFHISASSAGLCQMRLKSAEEMMCCVSYHGSCIIGGA